MFGFKVIQHDQKTLDLEELCVLISQVGFNFVNCLFWLAQGQTRRGQRLQCDPPWCRVAPAESAGMNASLQHRKADCPTRRPKSFPCVCLCISRDTRQQIRAISTEGVNNEAENSCCRWRCVVGTPFSSTSCSFIFATRYCSERVSDSMPSAAT